MFDKTIESAHMAIHQAVTETLKAGLPNLPETTRNALAVSLALKLRAQIAERDAQLAAAHEALGNMLVLFVAVIEMEKIDWEVYEAARKTYLAARKPTQDKEPS